MQTHVRAAATLSIALGFVPYALQAPSSASEGGGTPVTTAATTRASGDRDGGSRQQIGEGARRGRTGGLADLPASATRSRDRLARLMWRSPA